MPIFHRPILLLLAAILVLASTGWIAAAQDAEFAAAVQQMRALSQAGKDKETEAVAERLIARTRAKNGEESLAMALALEWLSEAYADQRRYQEQLAALQRALAIRKKHAAADDPSLVLNYNNTASALMKLERVKEALPLLQLTLSIREKISGPEHLETASALDGLANAQVSDYADPDNLRNYEMSMRRALAIRTKRAGAQSREVAATLNDMAETFGGNERIEEAEQLFGQALAIYERLGNKAWLIEALTNQCEFYSNRGRHKEATLAVERALVLAERWARENPKREPLGRMAVAEAMSNLGSSYLDEGRVDESLALLERALSVMEQAAGKESPNLIPFLQRLGTTYHAARRFDAAALTIDRQLALIAKGTGRDTTEYGRALRVRAEVAHAQGRNAEAVALSTQSVAIMDRFFNNDGSLLGMTLAVHGSTLAANDKPAEARRVFERAVTVLSQSSGRQNPYTAAALRGLASNECAMGDHASALAHAREVAATFTRRAELGLSGAGPARRELYSAGAYSPLICAAFGQASKSGADREQLASEALAAAQHEEHTQAAEALARMAARASAAKPEIASLVRTQQDLAAQLEAADRSINDALAAGSRGGREAAKIDRLRKARMEIEARLAEAHAQLARRAPQLQALAYPKPLSIADVRGHLQDDEVLVAFLATDSASWVWAVSRTGLAWQRIPQGASQLKDAVAALRRPLDAWSKSPRGLDRLRADDTACAPPAGADPRGLNRPGGECGDDRRFSPARAHALYRTLLGPVEAVIRDKRHLIIVPSGPLTGLPFGVLTTEAPAGGPVSLKSFAAAPWLIRRHAITVLPSVASLRALRTGATTSRAPQPFLGIGDPDFSGGVAARGTAPTRVAEARGFASYYRGGQADLAALKQGLAPLPDAADELRAIARTLGAPEAHLLLGRNASERRLKALNQAGRLSDYRVLAFATHGLVAGEVQGLAEPAIALTIPQAVSEDDDGLLTASEAARLKLDADWVVLSACNTAAGGQPGAEALSGLARAFFYAGARALLVSHWPVASDAAVKLTTRSFEAVAAEPQLGRAEALRRAMLTLIEKGAPHEAHPAYWAPFIVVGEGGAQR